MIVTYFVGTWLRAYWKMIVCSTFDSMTSISSTDIKTLSSTIHSCCHFNFIAYVVTTVYQGNSPSPSSTLDKHKSQDSNTRYLMNDIK